MPFTIRFVRIRGLLAAVVFGGCLCFAPQPGRAADAASGSLAAAEAAFQKGDLPGAIALAGRLIGGTNADYRACFLRGRAYETLRQHEKALADYDAGIKLNPRSAVGYQFRGAQHFRLGHIKESIADFDKFIEILPAQAPHHWQRGISLYYAGRFEDGRRQFELHQTVNPSDVENAAWHFLCVARASGLEKARAALIPIEGDPRVPMAQIHSLFAGKAKPEDVLAAAKAGNPVGTEAENQLFYAHLYLGLYYEAIGDAKLAREHILKAATDFKAEHYMGDVARVHARLLKQATK